MYYPTIEEVVRLHARLIELSGGSLEIRDHGALESAIAQPLMSFAGQDLYPTLIDKASALGFSLVMNHPFVDGNKRIGHAAMEIFLVRNGFEVSGHVDDHEEVILRLAAGEIEREDFTEWLRARVVPLSSA